MNSRMSYSNKISVNEEKRLDWRDDSLYEGREDWSNRCWAWEFLRRNLKYQKLCTDTKWGPTTAKQYLGTEFGRINLKRHTFSYGAKEDNEEHWLSEGIIQMKPNDKNDSIVVHHLSAGEVAIVFNLGSTLYSGKAAIAAQLYHAKKCLLNQLIKYEQKLPADKKPKIRKPHRDLWPLLLRLYDAKMHCNASADEIIKILYTSKRNKEKELDKLDKIAVGKKISTHFKLAKQMVDTGYLALIPLDFIQNRTKNNTKNVNLHSEISI
jgi:hypothetical protein